MKLPNAWKEVELGEIANFLRGPFGSAIKKSVCVEKGTDTYKVYEQGNVIRNDFKRGDYYLNKERFEKLKKFELISNDIAITCAGTLGKIAIVPEGIERGLINSVLMRIRVDNSKVSNEYFIYLFRSSIIQDYISSRSQGAALKNLFATKILRTIQIILPPLEIQKKIVSLLEKAEKSKEWRKEADDLTNDFLKSVFLEMFEDKTKFELIKLGDVASFCMGGTPPSSEINSATANIPWLKGSDLVKEYIYDSSNFISLKGVDQSRARYYDPGTVLIGRTGQGKTRGKTAIMQFKATTNETVIAIFPELNKVISEYVHFNLKFRYQELRDLAGDNQRGGITQMDLNNLKMTLPPIELQNKFASIVKKVEVVKEQQKHSKNQIDNLFNVLVQKAFKGELL